ncbi:hypothetical protein PIB30_035910 [Stylosanthes scabra]|uniref:GDSL esterase/lipase n=1 Tax=Stylosanthes scabra TaxID=79078 RepID=A0ABU6XAT9_9FABA|nr:hypothetical protein [Stylosanthes scabra]
MGLAAEQMGAPLLKPYMGIKKGKIDSWNTTEGVNFAVAGATALDSSYYLEKGIYNIKTNYTLGVQLNWFMDLLPSICTSPSECKELLGSSLFLVGEIGGNDFNHPLYIGKSVEELRTYVPDVINGISSTISKLIDVGAQTLVVPGNFPIGCNYIYLSMFKTEDVEAYDEIGCLRWLNRFAEYYNKQLFAEINRLQVLHPNVNIIYADYYHAALQVYQSPKQYGFTESLLSACCPPLDLPDKSEGSLDCGRPGGVVCDNPSEYISWDESSSTSSRCFTTIYSFGDSITDTGNLYFDDNTDNHISATQALVLTFPTVYPCRSLEIRATLKILVEAEVFLPRPNRTEPRRVHPRSPPTTELFHFSTRTTTFTFSTTNNFHCAMRIAEQMGIPLLKPYLGIKNGELRDYWKPRREGVNFAVAGATALDPSFFLDKGINDIQTNYSLSVQLDWFMDLLPSICSNSSSGCKEVLGKSLFFVGEIGGNDINHPLFKDTSADEIIRTYVPNVINEISSTINKLIEVGAQTLVVPGNFPLGCSFFYLTKYHTNDMDEYDQAGCLKWLNKLAEYYNHKLYNELNRLQVLHPRTNIIFADYYHAALKLYQSPKLFGE